MATAEITRPEASLLGTYTHLTDLSEKERFTDTRPEVSSRVLVERVVSVSARGRPVQFKYKDSGDPLPNWLSPVLQGFANLLTLPNNWDGEGAAMIDRETINRALGAIDQLLDRDAPAPSIVPTPNSGLQIEWHRDAKDLEIEFRPNGHTDFYYFDEVTGQEHEGPVGNRFVFLSEYLGRMW